MTTELPFPNDTFCLVVFDPPHHTAKRMGNGGSKAHHAFGMLLSGWEEMIRDGFAECFRVLRPGGTLIFKWCSSEIPLKRVLALTPELPLFGHKSSKKATTHWIAFIKL